MALASLWILHQLVCTFRTTVSLGCRLASPPGGRVEQPVVNCRNAFLSSEDMPHKTLTNLRKPGLKEQKHSYVHLAIDGNEPRHTILYYLCINNPPSNIHMLEEQACLVSQQYTLPHPTHNIHIVSEQDC